MADVFISYARADAAVAARVAQALRESGLSVWLDQDLPAHRSYSEVIEEQLDGAAAVVVLWSKDSVASQWVRSEANRARETARLVQLRLDDARLPMPFDQIQCAHIGRWKGQRSSPAWRTVEASVLALAGGEPRPAARAARDTRLNRRRMLIGGGAAAAVIAGAVGWRMRPSAEPLSPEAQLLLQKGMDALQANDALDPEDEGSTSQAIALLNEATRVAPQSADAWGALALAYAARRRAAPLDERAGLESRGLSAARSALAIQPDEPRSLAAVQLMKPLYRRWLQAERDARRAMAINPRFPILVFVLSEVLGNVGRWREAMHLSNRLDRKRFLLPGADRKVIINLWAAGDLQGADEAVKAAAERWPKHRQIWRTQVAYLLYSGRPGQALAILEDQRQLPPEVAPGLVAAATATARSIAGQLPAAEAIRTNLDYVASAPASALQAAQAITALGDAATAMRMLEGYYFSAGDFARLAPPAGDQDRTTAPLFQPPMRPLWGRPDFAALLRRTGLEDYWRRSATRPDFRA